MSRCLRRPVAGGADRAGEHASTGRRCAADRQAKMSALPHSQRGSILVAVLFLAGLLGIFAAVAATVMHAAADSSRGFAEDLRAKEAMRAAIEQVVGATGTSVQQMHGFATVALAKARVTLMVRDEASRIDLNHAKPELL